MSEKNGSAARIRGLLAILSACVCAALALGLGLTAHAAQSAEPSSRTAELLPVRENPVAALGDIFYVIRSDGTLIESFRGYGERDTGSGFTFNQTREVMDNAAAVYASEESAVLAVDREGGLWYVRWGRVDSWIRAILPDFIQHYDDYPKPLKLLENVAMASADGYHAVILKRDGTLWVAGSNKYGAPWLDKEDDNEDFYFTQIMDNVIWADTTDYGGYAVTAGHELWAWGLSGDSTGPERLLDGVSRVCSNNTAITEDGKVLNWYYTAQEDGSRIWSEPYAVELDGEAVQSGRGYYILEDGSIWANTAGWMNRMNDHERHMLLKYGVMLQPDWCKLTPDSAVFQDLGVKDAAYAAIGQTKTVVLDKNGVLWGIYDLNREWEGDFDPFQPIRLMDGCYGSKGPATYGMENFKKVQEYQPGTFSDVKESDWFYDNVKAAYELDLMIGNAGKFRPNDTITLGEAAAIVSRVRAAYWGEKLEFPAMQTWWQPYVYYAQATELHQLQEPFNSLGEYQGLNYNRTATRSELASLLCRTLPLAELPELNENPAFSDFNADPMEPYCVYEDEIIWMAQAGIVAGKDNGTFDPDAPVKRCEAAAMLTRCAFPELRIGITGQADNPFADRNSVFTEYGAEDVTMCYYLGVAKGYPDGSFGYGKTITRQEVAALLFRAYAVCGGERPAETAELSFRDRDTIQDWARDDVAALLEWKVMAGDDKGNFDPNGLCTYEQAVAMFLRLYDNAPVRHSNGNVKQMFTYEQCMEYLLSQGVPYSVRKEATVVGPYATYVRMDEGVMMGRTTKILFVYRGGGVRVAEPEINTGMFGGIPASAAIENTRFSPDGRTFSCDIQAPVYGAGECSTCHVEVDLDTLACKVIEIGTPSEI